MKRLFIGLLVFLPVGCQRPPDHPEIRDVLAKQTQAWNRGSLEAYMLAYWKSDDLLFASPQQQFHGWQEVSQQYRRSYPTSGAMGQLSFEDVEVAMVGPDAAEVSARYHLKTPRTLQRGRFFLILRRIEGAWVIAKHYAFGE